MGELLDLAVYNPAILSDTAFISGFVARQTLAERLLHRLGETTVDGLATHHLILGQRGMGKTSLLRRLALGVRNDPRLSQVLLPLSFREEQYNVHNLSVFWLNCLDALGGWFEQTGETGKAAALDRDLARLDQGQAGADTEGQEALETFYRWTRQEGRRPLLLLDNLDIILNALSKQQWSLRRELQRPGGIVVVGASTGWLEATEAKNAAFYDFFQVTLLEPLSADELLGCLRRLAQQRGEPGRAVLGLLAADPGRIRAVHDLTGGNPRTLTLLYLLLETDTGGDVLTDLDRLLDQVSVLYKARVEDLAPQSRVVLDAVALAWDPVIAAEIAGASGLETRIVSAQLTRLERDGIVQKVSVSRSNRDAFQLAERFFNIWYLMRHGQRRQRTRLRWLSAFLRRFYSPDQGDLPLPFQGPLEDTGVADQEVRDTNPMGLVPASHRLAMALLGDETEPVGDADFNAIAGRHPAGEANLLRALRALVRHDLPTAADRFAAALAEPHEAVPTLYQGLVLLFLREAARRNQGAPLLAALRERGIPDTHWPLMAAYDAYVHGEARLMDVNPEVRIAARRIYAWLDAPRRVP